MRNEQIEATNPVKKFFSKVGIGLLFLVLIGGVIALSIPAVSNANNNRALTQHDGDWALYVEHHEWCSATSTSTTTWERLVELTITNGRMDWDTFQQGDSNDELHASIETLKNQLVLFVADTKDGGNFAFFLIYRNGTLRYYRQENIWCSNWSEIIGTESVLHLYLERV